MISKLKYLGLSSALILALISIGRCLPIQALQTDLHQAMDEINQLYHILNTKPKQDISARIDEISAQFLGKPYLLNALGEGSNGDFDQAPLYRMDAFDCETYVDTVLALALANDSIEFQQCIRQIRYRRGKVSFIDRNHFTCIDWNKNNQQQGYLKDITTTIRDQNHRIVALYATALIDKSAWYQHFSGDKIRLQQKSEVELTKRLAQLKQQALQLPKTLSIIPYIPFNAIFDDTGNPHLSILQQIPHGAVVEIIRPNWNLVKQIGTNLNVSHLGFAIWKADTLMFREASGEAKQVTEKPLIEYLKKAQKSPTMKGINVQAVIPTQPLGNLCTK